MAAERPVAALNVRGTDPVFVGLAADLDLLLSYQARRSVPPRLFATLVSEVLDNLGVIDASPKVELDGVGIGCETVRAELEVAGRGVAELRHEIVAIPAVPA